MKGGSEPAVLFSVDEGIATVVINRPEARNSLNVAVIQGLDEAWRETRDNPEIKAVVVRGSGDQYFLTGIDTALLAGAPEIHEFRAWLRDSAGDVPSKTSPWLKGFNLWKPVVAAVNGHCVATGMGLLTAADIRVAADHVSFAAMEVRLGQNANNGALTRLPRQVAYVHAMMLLLTGVRIGADEALTIGLVNEVVSREMLMPRAYEIARTLANRHQREIQITKQAVIRGLDMGLSMAITEEALYREMLASRRPLPKRQIE